MQYGKQKDAAEREQPEMSGLKRAAQKCVCSKMIPLYGIIFSTASPSGPSAEQLLLSVCLSVEFFTVPSSHAFSSFAVRHSLIRDLET